MTTNNAGLGGTEPPQRSARRPPRRGRPAMRAAGLAIGMMRRGPDLLRFKAARPFVPPARVTAPAFGEGSLQCSIAAFDIVGFGDRRRDDDVQLYVRTQLYRILREAFDQAGVPWQTCHREDRGDGVLVVVPPLISPELLISPLIDHVRAGLRRHNKLSSEAAQMRVRMALHTGQVHFDAYGVAGQALVHVFRLLEAPMFKVAFADAPCEVGLLASDRLYDDIIRHAPGLIDPDLYDAINVSVKETQARAWAYFPPGVFRPMLDEAMRMRPVVPAATGVREV